MKQRAITSLLIVVGLVAVLFLSWTPVYPIILSVFSVFAAFEVLKVFNLHFRLFLAVPAYLISAIMPCLAFILDKQKTGLFGLPANLVFLLILAATLYAFMLYLFVVAVCERGRMPFGEFASAFIMVVYMVTAFSALSLIRYIDGIGLFCLGMILISAWVTDVGAYLVGYFFGKHKLIPEVSPKKTVEGAIGGILSSVGGMMLYGLIVSLVTSKIDAIHAVSPNYLVLGLAGGVLSVISQVGDLIASVIKRENGVKDYGKIFPGHGGVMDRFDSILAVSMATLIICLLVAPFSIV